MITALIILAYALGALCGFGALAYLFLVLLFWAVDQGES